MASERHH